jgi:hypothetical protein
MPSHGPYKDPVSSDLAGSRWWHPAGFRRMVAKDPRETVVELDREKQTLGGRDLRLRRSRGRRESTYCGHSRQRPWTPQLGGSAPTGVASARTGERAKAAIPLPARNRVHRPCHRCCIGACASALSGVGGFAQRKCKGGMGHDGPARRAWRTTKSLAANTPLREVGRPGLCLEIVGGQPGRYARQRNLCQKQAAAHQCVVRVIDVNHCCISLIDPRERVRGDHVA